MTETERRDANRRCAVALGWTRLRKKTVWIDKRDVLDRFAGRDPVEIWVGISPDGGDEREIIDYHGSLDAVADALPAGYDIDIHRRIDWVYTATIWQTSPHWHAQCWEGRGATRQEAAGAALTVYAEAQQLQAQGQAGEGER